jgi:hypothetical protein
MPVDVGKVLAEEGIKVRSFKFGNQYTLCPHCSHSRKGSHKKIRCLSVKIDQNGVVWNCHHCSWSGCENQKSERSSSGRGGVQGAKRREGGGYGALQRNALARWVGGT